MFAVEIPSLYFYGRCARSRAATGTHPDRNGTAQDGTESAAPPERIRTALAAMPPATAEEIAAAIGLESVTTAACLDEMTARCSVMFNPLTKRYSLPKPRHLSRHSASS